MTLLLRITTLSVATALVVFGALGMLICFMFLWSSDMRDITGAGLGFVAGATMLGSGCISLAIASRVATATTTSA
jgi:hypothetical protein